MPSSSSQEQQTFDKERHIRYFTSCLQTLPYVYQSLDTNRLTLVHFAVNGLDILNALENNIEINKTNIINWIYSLQTIPITDANTTDDNISINNNNGGFKGGTYLGNSFRYDNNDKDEGTCDEYDHSHIAMTYTALLTLQTLGDDLSRVNKSAILKSLKALQQPDGSFQCNTKHGSENDLRFLYCACSICYILNDCNSNNNNDWSMSSCINISNAISFIKKCRSYDGAFGLYTTCEGHGGSTFCAIASLTLMGKLDDVLDNNYIDNNNLISWRKSLLHWCINRQCHADNASKVDYNYLSPSAGMQGRPNKDEDTCYSYWIGGTLELLNGTKFIDTVRLKNYIFSCQTLYGGFSKVLDGNPDLLHSFYSLCWLSLSQKYLMEYDNDIKDSKNDATPEIKNYSLNNLNCVLGVVKKE